MAQQQLPTRSTAACGCGCGNPAAPRLKFFGNHREALQTARRRLRRTKKWARHEKIDFSVTFDDIRTMVLEAWPNVDWRVVRLDKARGFVPGNVFLRKIKSRAPVKPAEPGDAGRQIHAGLPPKEAALARPDEVAAAYARQDGKCFYSGRLLSLSGKRRSPDSAHVIVSEEVGERRLRLVLWAVKAAMSWGPDHMVRLAHDISKHMNDRAAKAEKKKEQQRNHGQAHRS